MDANPVFFQAFPLNARCGMRSGHPHSGTIVEMIAKYRIMLDFAVFISDWTMV
jgi:hypothetical protein